MTNIFFEETSCIFAWTNLSIMKVDFLFKMMDCCNYLFKFFFGCFVVFFKKKRRISSKKFCPKIIKIKTTTLMFGCWRQVGHPKRYPSPNRTKTPADAAAAVVVVVAVAARRKAVLKRRRRLLSLAACLKAAAASRQACCTQLPSRVGGVATAWRQTQCKRLFRIGWSSAAAPGRALWSARSVSPCGSASLCRTARPPPAAASDRRHSCETNKTMCHRCIWTRRWAPACLLFGNSLYIRSALDNLSKQWLF